MHKKKRLQPDPAATELEAEMPWRVRWTCYLIPSVPEKTHRRLEPIRGAGGAGCTARARWGESECAGLLNYHIARTGDL